VSELDEAIKEFALDIWHLALDEGYGTPQKRATLVSNREEEFKKYMKTLTLSLTVFSHTSDNDDDLLAQIAERIKAL